MTKQLMQLFIESFIGDIDLVMVGLCMAKIINHLRDLRVAVAEVRDSGRGVGTYDG